MKRVFATLCVLTFTTACAPTSHDFGYNITLSRASETDLIFCALKADQLGEAIVWESRKRWLFEILTATAIGAAGGAIAGAVAPGFSTGKGAAFGAVGGASIAGGNIALTDRSTVKKAAMALCLQHKGYTTIWGPQLQRQAPITIQVPSGDSYSRDLNMHPIPDKTPDVSNHKPPKK